MCASNTRIFTLHPWQVASFLLSNLSGSQLSVCSTVATVIPDSVAVQSQWATRPSSMARSLQPWRTPAVHWVTTAMLWTTKIGSVTNQIVACTSMAKCPDLRWKIKTCSSLTSYPPPSPHPTSSKIPAGLGCKGSAINGSTMSSWFRNYIDVKWGYGKSLDHEKRLIWHR